MTNSGDLHSQIYCAFFNVLSYVLDINAICTRLVVLFHSTFSWQILLSASLHGLDVIILLWSSHLFLYKAGKYLYFWSSLFVHREVIYVARNSIWQYTGMSCQRQVICMLTKKWSRVSICQRNIHSVDILSWFQQLLLLLVIECLNFVEENSPAWKFSVWFSCLSAYSANSRKTRHCIIYVRTLWPSI